MRHNIMQEPKRWDHCKGQDGPVKRQHVWEEVACDLILDEHLRKQWWRAFRCSCGDEYAEIYEWNNELQLACLAMGIDVMFLGGDPHDN